MWFRPAAELFPQTVRYTEASYTGNGMRQRPRVVLVAGFGGLLLIMAAAEAGALLFLNSLRHNDTALQARFLARNRTLERIRSNIYLSGTFVRDSLLAPEQSGARAQLATLDGLRRDSESALTSYASALEPEEAAPFQDLRSQIEAYWNVLDRTLAWTGEERGKYRDAFFYEELVPRRTSMLQIADRIEALNEEALRRGDMKLGDLFGRLQFGLLAMIAVTLVGGASLAALTIFHILKLEGEVQKRLTESVHAQSSLQELSARLVRAQEEERRALSRELHDEVAQAFSAVLMEAENLLDLASAPEVRAHLDSIRAVAEKGMNEIRNMALLLRPSMLDDFGLLPALEWQAREIGRRTGLRVQVASEMPGELPEEHKTCVYRVVQEALNNCAQHAQASAVQVCVRHEAGEILVTVQDDGSGFDPQRVRGLGLLGMEERARHLGGSFQIDSRPGRGTLLSVALPLAAIPDVVEIRAPTLEPELVWNGGLADGADSHSAG
ncbi:MAG: ATP-binding protein [Bryobacteraceae bacterium]|jgi:signal transduction histidine kinase